MSELTLALRQAGWDWRATLRNPAAFFFGLAMPVLFLVILATVFGNETVDERGGIRVSTYYVPTVITLGIISMTFVNLAMALVIEREDRVLKRLRGTPLPMRAFMAGRIAAAVGFATVLTLLLLAIGKLAYDVSLPGSTIPGVIVGLAVGCSAFCCLGAAISSFIPNEDAAPAALNLVVLPLYFISGIFFPMDTAPGWLLTVADIFPVKHLSETLLEAFDPRTTGSGIAWGHLGLVAAWGAAGLGVALASFRWTPRGE